MFKNESPGSTDTPVGVNQYHGKHESGGPQCRARSRRRYLRTSCNKSFESPRISWKSPLSMAVSLARPGNYQQKNS